jgi:hypothetical protein
MDTKMPLLASLAGHDRAVEGISTVIEDGSSTVGDPRVGCDASIAFAQWILALLDDVR